MLTATDKAMIKASFEEVFENMNSVIWKTRTVCDCQDEYGVFDPECVDCDGLGYVETSSTVAADVQELKGDERIVVDAGILNVGDIVIRTSIDNQIQIDDVLTYNSKSYQIRYVILDQLESFLEVGGHKVA